MSDFILHLTAQSSHPASQELQGHPVCLKGQHYFLSGCKLEPSLHSITAALHFERLLSAKETCQVLCVTQ